MEELIALGSWLLVVIFVLLQIFLSLRPFFVWGLITPLIFGFVWFYFGAGSGVIPIVDLELNQAAMDFYVQIGRLGVLVGLAILVLCRLALLARRSYLRKRREQRLALKREREQRAREAASFGDTRPVMTEARPTASKATKKE